MAILSHFYTISPSKIKYMIKNCSTFVKCYYRYVTEEEESTTQITENKYQRLESKNSPERIAAPRQLRLEIAMKQTVRLIVIAFIIVALTIIGCALIYSVIMSWIKGTNEVMNVSGQFLLSLVEIISTIRQSVIKLPQVFDQKRNSDNLLMYLNEFHQRLESINPKKLIKSNSSIYDKKFISLSSAFIETPICNLPGFLLTNKSFTCANFSSGLGEEVR